ncbi:MAG: hypothetical protein LBJ18_03710 [Rickettsiales bacterium]|jgi:rRNA maturation endonuclease Nob1|nr:hypothetical protein [Rickettsiales bacterium]
MIKDKNKLCEKCALIFLKSSFNFCPYCGKKLKATDLQINYSEHYMPIAQINKVE